MNIPRNEMGHRYYTDLHIRLFKQIKELKEKGYQLKAIKAALARSLESDGEVVVPNDILEEDVVVALKDHTENEDEMVKTMDDRTLTTLMAEERAEQFRAMLGRMIGQAIEENNEKLSQDISRMVNDKVLKEVDYLMRVADERDEERFRQLDETIRLYQRENRGKAEAAASRIPFFSGGLWEKRRSLGEMGTSCKIKTIITKKAAVANKAQQLLCILLIREILALADSASGTYTCTCSAADACICIDLVFAVSLRDCIYRTFASAGTAANASIVNYICHDELPPFFIIVYIL